MSTVGTAPAPLPRPKYWAFLSYSHDDSGWAEWLHLAIETYRVPRRLVGSATPDGPTPRQLYPVFRDRDELPGAAELGEKIEEALRASRYLIVVCSPRAAVSHWVNAEVRTFKALRRENENRVLCLIVDGEPHGGDRREDDLECFPPAVRFRVGTAGELSDVPTDPVAGDARPGKDGKDGALLRLLAGMLSVGFDELRQRERVRRRRRQIRQALAVLGVLGLGVFSYLGMVDAGLALPGAGPIRTALDRHASSLFRRAHSYGDIHAAAAASRRQLMSRFRAILSADSWVPWSLAPPRKAEDNHEFWSHSQALAAVFSDPDATDEELAPFVPGLAIPFRAGALRRAGSVLYGWPAHPNTGDVTVAQPALWTAMALALALARPNLLDDATRSETMSHLETTQALLENYRPRGSTGGWGMFPLQDDPDAADPYTTVLALQALLETRKAALPWNGSVESRDALLGAAAAWLTDHFDAQQDPPGWRVSADATHDGLTLQVYSALLRAEDEAGVAVPDAILEAIPQHAIRCIDRTLEFPDQSGEFWSRPFKNHDGIEMTRSEGVGFFWYPWAIDTSTRWLARSARRARPAEELYRVRRALSHLVIDLGGSAVAKAVSKGTAVASEQLYCLSAARAAH